MFKFNNMCLLIIGLLVTLTACGSDKAKGPTEGTEKFSDQALSHRDFLTTNPEFSFKLSNDVTHFNRIWQQYTESQIEGDYQ